MSLCLHLRECASLFDFTIGKSTKSSRLHFSLLWHCCHFENAIFEHRLNPYKKWLQCTEDELAPFLPSPCLAYMLERWSWQWKTGLYLKRLSSLTEKYASFQHEASDLKELSPSSLSKHAATPPQRRQREKIGQSVTLCWCVVEVTARMYFSPHTSHALY